MEDLVGLEGLAFALGDLAGAAGEPVDRRSSSTVPGRIEGVPELLGPEPAPARGGSLLVGSRAATGALAHAWHDALMESPGSVDLMAVLNTVHQPWSPAHRRHGERLRRPGRASVRGVHAPQSPRDRRVLPGADGRLTIRMDAGDVALGPGEVFIVPKGVQHQPVSPEGATVLLIEPSVTVNTGDTPSELTAQRQVVRGGPPASVC